MIISTEDETEGRSDILINIILLCLYKPELCSRQGTSPGFDSCAYLGYLSAPDEDEFNAPEVEFLRIRVKVQDNRVELYTHRELYPFVHGPPEPVCIGWRWGKDTMGLCLFDVALGGLLHFIEGWRCRCW